MPPSDDFGLDDDDSAFIAAATQAEASRNDAFQASPRPAKRRRLSSSETEDDPEYYFPGELAELDEQSKRNSKYKIHIPKNGGFFKDQIFTQTQQGLDSSPSHFRGAVWKKPQQQLQPPPPPPPVFGQKAVNGNGVVPPSRPSVPGFRQTTLNGFSKRPSDVPVSNPTQSDADFAARLQAAEYAQRVVPQDPSRPKPTAVGSGSAAIFDELADLPSDAFSSSSPEKSPAKEIVTITSQQTASQVQVRGLRGPQHGLKQMTIFGQPATQDLSASQAAAKRHAWPLMSRDEPPTHHKLDERAMETWIYPTNLGTIRDYQYNIVSRSLFTNTLVALPTGLGKTFIAATVMLNYYRWTRDAQIVFMAPTKPLIAQQMEACYGIVGIPRHDTVLMTGETTPALRAEEWLEKRVFFMTPQTVINDLKTGICDPKKIVLAVVDEAHKATGGYAYTEVIKFLRRFNNSFRVQALTATPGSNVEAVQAVIDNLGIARVELRTESSLDITQYTHEKHTETQLFDFSDEQARVMEFFSKAIRPVLDKLNTQNAYWSRDPMQLTAYGLTTARQKWMASDAGRKAPMPIKGMINAAFTVLSSLAHNISLLKFHGIGPFYAGCLEFQKSVDSGQSKGKTATQIVQSEHFTKMMSMIRSWTSNVDFIGHPKLEYLREVVLNHFRNAGEGARGADVPPSATRIMVFASYRDSTEEICRVLKRSESTIRPHVFVGQAASKGSEGMDQKRQNAVIQDFKSGKYNTLVATSIGEEGLDIGTVDLIVCYDASASPIRMLQRIGRTGRKRVGNVVLLLMRGKEENDYAKAQDNYAYIQKTIADPDKYEYRVDQSPRILPKEIKPVADKRMIEIPVENSQPINLNEKGRKARGKAKLKRPPKKFHMPDGVQTGFVKASRLDSDADESGEEPVPKRRKKSDTTKPAKFKKTVIEPSIEPAPLPFLEDVLLTGVQQRELERKYAHTVNEEVDLVIRAPDTKRFPEAVRDQEVTKYMRHGRAYNVVAETMRAIQDTDSAKVDRMMKLGRLENLQDAGNAKYRLANPSYQRNSDEDSELPQNPLPSVATKKSAKPNPKKEQPLQRTASIKSVAATEPDDSLSVPPAKKARGRPRKNIGIQRMTSYGSGAAEGEESSPEPTPANMRIGTQGIDLGSRDTSGDEEDEELDSDLAEFVVKSDQPIEMASSSQQLPDDTQPYKSLRSVKARPAQATQGIEAIDSDSSHTDPGLAEMDGAEEDDDDSVVEEVSAPVAATSRGRRKRIVDDSDDE